MAHRAGDHDGQTAEPGPSPGAFAAIANEDGGACTKQHFANVHCDMSAPTSALDDYS